MTPFTRDTDDEVNVSANPHLNDVLALNLTRRAALRGAVGVTTGVLLGTVRQAAANPDQRTVGLHLGFDAVPKNKLDRVTVPTGYCVSILHGLGDPLLADGDSWKGDGSETAESYAHRIGDGHDGMYFFGLADNGAFAANRSNRGLLVVNHEYVTSPFVLHPQGITQGAQRVAAEAHKEMLAHGVSVVEVRRSTGNGMAVVRGSRFNRRVTATTDMDISGPAMAHDLMRTRFSAMAPAPVAPKTTVPAATPPGALT